MRKSSRLLVVVIFTLLLGSSFLTAQEKQPQRYLAVTTLHWNMDMDDFSMKEWKAVEKEFNDKVTAKNEYVLATNFGIHFMTADNTELVYVQLFNSWNDIDKASKRNGELTKAAWPDEAKRDAFLKKRDSYYDDFHSDEIYATISGAKPYMEEEDKEMLFYVRKSHLAFPDDGNGKEFKALRDPFIKNVIHKNQYIKGYYPYVHAWGADKRDFVEVFVIESLDALDKSFEENAKLNKERFSDEIKQKDTGKKMEKYFTGFHADYVYKSVPGISKKMPPPPTPTPSE